MSKKKSKGKPLDFAKYMNQEKIKEKSKAERAERAEKKKELRSAYSTVNNALETKKKASVSKTDLGTVSGVFRSTTKGFGFVQILDEEGNVAKEIFIPASAKKNAFSNDVVEVMITWEGKGDKKSEGEVVKVLKRGTNYITGVFQKNGSSGFVIPDDKSIDGDIYISKEHTKGAVTGHRVYVRIDSYGTKNKKPEGRITEILGHIDDPHSDLKVTLKNFDIFPEFPMEVKLEVENIPEEVSEKDKLGRLDLRNLLTVTIDGADAKDLDDAITLSETEDGYSLGVHIADVSNYVKEGTALDDEAINRSTSVYLINKVVPMLPHELSNGICSLNQGVDRLALSCIMEIDKEGNIVSHKIAETVINVTRRMNYDEVSDIIRGPKSHVKEYGEDLVQMFVLMGKVAKLLRKKRVKRGALDFDFLESKVILDENDAPVEIKPYDRNEASKIIEDFMLAANETVAEDYYWQELPFLYRTHENPDSEKMDKLLLFAKNYGINIRVNRNDIHPGDVQRLLEKIKGLDVEALISRLTLRSMKQAHYTTTCDGHFGLASKYYCHFTSPIRRYPDLQIHRIIKENLQGQLTDSRISHYNMILGDIAKQTSSKERNAEQAEREIVRMKQIEYMQKHLGEGFEGVVSGVTNWGIYVELPNTVEGMISVESLTDDYYKFDREKMMLYGEKKHKTYILGQKVFIEVMDADKINKKIDFKIIGEKRFKSLTGAIEEEL